MYSLDFSDLYREAPVQALPLQQARFSGQELQAYLTHFSPGSQLSGVEMRNLAGQLVYLLKHAKGSVLLNAQGQRLDPIAESLAAELVKMDYQGTGQLQKLELLPSSAGNYFSSQPVYRATFADSQKTEIYLDPGSGSLLARRKALWGLYNRMWEFHLMKYTPSKNLNKALLLICALLNALVAITGFVKFFRWGFRLRHPNQLKN